MSISLGSLVVDLIANTAGFITGMDKASYAGRKAQKELQESFRDLGDKISGSLQGAFASFGQFGQVVGEFSRTMSEAFDGIGKSTSGITLAVGALGGLAAAGIAAAGAMLELGKGGAEVVEHLSLISQKTGIGVRDLQVFEAAGKTVNISLDDMVTGLRKFDQALLNTGKGTASQGVLKELGVTAKDNREALLQVADAFAKMEDGARKNSDAVALFGKSGLQLIPLMNKGRQGIEEWREAVDKFGPIVGEKAVDALEKHKKSVTELSLEYDRMKVDVEQSVLPTLTKLTNWFNTHGGFQGVLAGLGGGRGAAAVLKAQLEAQQALTAEANEDSEKKNESLHKQEELNNSLQKNFDILKFGGTAAYALSQARLDLEGAVQNGLWKQASAIQSQLPALEKAAQLEVQRAATAERFRKTMESLQQGAAFVKPALPQKPLEHNELAVLFPNLNRDKNPLEGAPDIGQPDILKSLDGMPEFLKKIEVGKDSVDEFYRDWDRNSKGTSDSVNATYDKQWAHFQGLFNLQEITEEQFKDISLKIEAERQAGLKRLREDTGTSTFRDAWQDMFQQIEASGRDFARSITQDIGSAIESLNAQLARFVTTGKGLNIKQIGQDLSTNLVSSVLKKGESSLFGSLGGLFGLDSSKPDGSANNPLHVTFDTSSLAGAAAGFGSLPLGNLSSLLSSSPLSSTGGLTNLASKIGGGFGSFFSSIGSFFGGFLAEGGDTQPGKAYIVGEKRPELFMPRSAGTVVPSIPTGDSKNITVQNVLQVHGVTDADSFRKSQPQIFRDLQRGQSLALSRA
ncbi:MAG TPA: hypothetical protein VNX66_04030 [Candidatus Sulfotelmatobacter sp.]|jgi:hypothetical protein|nr:hypothetical protein [Candidatus Sulfotelmatobacter sp.]